MVDELVPPSILRQIALKAAERVAGRGVPLRKPQGAFVGCAAGRAIRSAGAWSTPRRGRQVLKKTGGPLSRSARGPRGGRGRAGARHSARVWQSSTASSANWPWPSVSASWSSSSSPPPRSRRTMECRRGRPAPAVDTAGGGRLRLHGRRHRRHRGDHSEVEVGLKDTDLQPGGQGSQGGHRHPRRPAQAPADHAITSSSRPAALLSGADEWHALRPGRPGDRSGVRGSRGQAAGAGGHRGATSGPARSSPPTRPPSRFPGLAEGGRPPGAGTGHALLLAGREDAAAGGHRDRAHRPETIVTAVHVRPQAGQDGHRGAGPSRASGSTASWRPT